MKSYLTFAGALCVAIVCLLTPESSALAASAQFMKTGGFLAIAAVLGAVVLCLMGGIMGIILGRGAAFAVNFFLRWPTEVSMLAMVAAITVSGIVGIIFGYYPAWKASRPDPIEALRYE